MMTRTIPSIENISTRQLWRVVSPETLLNDESMRREISARLARVVASAKMALPEVEEELSLLAIGVMRPLGEVMRKLPWRPGLHQHALFDLRQSLALWAVLHPSHPQARYNWHEAPTGRILLAQGLATWAADQPGPNKRTLSTPRHRRTPEQRREVAVWQRQRRTLHRMALGWLENGMTMRWLDVLQQSEDLQLKPLEDVHLAPTTPDQTAGPALVVMQKPVDPDAHSSREKKEQANYWNALSAPMPLIATPPVERLHQRLLAEFPWMGPTIDRICTEQKLRQKGTKGEWFGIRPLLLVGPPSAGKSRFVRRLAEIAELPHRLINAGGSTENRDLAGTAAGWGTATPSAVLWLIREGGAANPLIGVDEVDKVSESTRNGNLIHTLLTLLERETAERWHDECLQRDVNLSTVNWVLLANQLGPVPAVLRSRLGIVEVARPKGAHFQTILATMRSDLANELGVTVSALPPLHPDAERYLQLRFARGASMRQVQAALRRALAVDGDFGATGLP